MKTIHEDEGYETAGNNGNKLLKLNGGPETTNLTSAAVNPVPPPPQTSATVTSASASGPPPPPEATPTTAIAAPSNVVNAAAADTTTNQQQRTIKCASESGVGKILPGQPTSKKVLSKRKTTVKVADTRSVFFSFTHIIIIIFFLHQR